jgi:hypothetical protein
MVFCEVVYAINVMYKFVIHWPTCVKMQMVMDQFKGGVVYHVFKEQ